ncbi:MAG: serine/threonine-protein kinase, partial [Bacteroidota bacterium]
ALAASVTAWRGHGTFASGVVARQPVATTPVPPAASAPAEAVAAPRPPAKVHAFASPPASEPVSRWIGRYEIVALIGTGGIAEVYQARFMGGTLFRRPIALKVLQPPFARQPRVVEHFLGEARLGSLLDHPNIVQILDFGSAHQDYFIAMELIDGADLARLIGMSHQLGRPIPVPVALAILRGICDGLHAAHTLRAGDGSALELLHRDVKGANIFVSRNGVVKIGDFGIARSDTLANPGGVRGTPGYMAPEQRLGYAVDRRSDLYGVGAVAYELLAGFSVNLDVALLADKGIAGWPHLESLSKFRHDISPRLEAIVMQALAYDPRDRFADCAELERALASVTPPRHRAAPIEIIAGWIESMLGASADSSGAHPGSGWRGDRTGSRSGATREPIRL